MVCYASSKRPVLIGQLMQHPYVRLLRKEHNSQIFRMPLQTSQLEEGIAGVAVAGQPKVSGGV